MKHKSKYLITGVFVGVLFTFVSMSAINVIARISQEDITVNFNNIRIAVDGVYVQTQYDPFIFEGRTFLPVSDVANAVGFDVTWEEATNTVHLTSRNIVANVPNYTVHTPSQPQQTVTVDPKPQTANYQTATPAQQSTITIPSNITPRPAARPGGPSNPTITAQRAVEISRDHLVSIGVTNARFEYVYMDMEGGVWVWSVEFDGPGRSYEFYVNVNTGEFVGTPGISS